MKSLKESIFDEKENMDKIDNTVHIKAIQKAWLKNVNAVWISDKDHFGRELHIGDVVYNMDSKHIGVITDIYEESGTTMITMNNLVGEWSGETIASNHILIPKSCVKEFIKVITAKK